MMKLIPIISNEAPKMKNALWIKPVGNHFTILTPNNGNWKEQQDSIPEVTNIAAIPASLLDELKCGDRVAKVTGEQKHLYTVTYKEEKHGLCLSYIDAENAETVAYDYNGSTKQWAWTNTTVTPLV